MSEELDWISAIDFYHAISLESLLNGASITNFFDKMERIERLAKRYFTFLEKSRESLGITITTHLHLTKKHYFLVPLSEKNGATKEYLNWDAVPYFPVLLEVSLEEHIKQIRLAEIIRDETSTQLSTQFFLQKKSYAIVPYKKIE